MDTAFIIDESPVLFKIGIAKKDIVSQEIIVENVTPTVNRGKLGFVTTRQRRQAGSIREAPGFLNLGYDLWLITM
jgi:hypothetical protein